MKNSYYKGVDAGIFSLFTLLFMAVYLACQLFVGIFNLIFKKKE